MDFGVGQGGFKKPFLSEPVGAQGLHWLQLKESLSKKSHNESSGKAGKRRLRNG
jgi:hypothetical protein